MPRALGWKFVEERFGREMLGNRTQAPAVRGLSLEVRRGDKAGGAVLLLLERLEPGKRAILVHKCAGGIG